MSGVGGTSPRAGSFLPGWRPLANFLGTPGERWETLLPLALAVGLLSGLSAVCLRSAVHALFELLDGARVGPGAALLPAAGAFLGSWIVASLCREPPGHGVPEVLRAVCRDGGRMRRRSMFSRWLGSLFNVSAGGSAGLEGPIVFSGAAIGSAVGGFFKRDERQRSILLACGVAGGIAGVFNAPMTGMIFAMEVVLAEWSALSIVPVVSSAVAATELSRLFLANEPAFTHADFSMLPGDLAACLGLGLLCGLASVVLVRVIRHSGALAARLPGGRLLPPLLFGLGVGVVALAAPQAIGEGYSTVQLAIDSDLGGGLALCAGILIAKLATTGMTLGSGAPGGVFAPCLVLGALVGVCFHRGVGELLPAGADLAVEGSYALVGMAGLVAGVMQAPLTGILLVMEVTRGYEVILPLMIVSVLSLLVARRFDHFSMYAQELAERGDLLRPGTDRRILADVALTETLDEDVTPVTEDLTLVELTQVVRDSRRNHFPVLARADGRYLGMLELGSVRELLLDPALARLTLVGTVMDPSVARIPHDTSLAAALDILEQNRAWVLPVVDGGRFVGLLSKSTLFDHYRQELSVQVGD